MQLAVDIGNTFAKAALFEGEKQLGFLRFEISKPEILKELFAGFGHPDAAMIASVTASDNGLTQMLEEICPVYHLSHETPLPFRITYEHPQTLGRDRIAAVAAAYKRFPGKNVLVIDMGSCITYDILQADGEYPGGIISPGIMMRLQAMHHFTSKLPLADFHAETPLTGRNTGMALNAGALWGTRAETEGIIRLYEEIYEDLTVLVGGGDNIYFDKKFRISIFAAPNLVVEGLKFIMDFNKIG